MPVLYLNNYVRHPFGEIESEFPGVCRHIAEEERKIGPQQDIDLSHVMTAEYLKENSALALVNTEKNEEMLRGVPHEDFRDLSIIAKCSLDVPAKMDGAVTVDNRYGSRFLPNVVWPFARAAAAKWRGLAKRADLTRNCRGRFVK